MAIWVMRHGIAVSETKDPKRPLSDEGIERSRKVAQNLSALEFACEEIWYSTKLRSQQTAEIMRQEAFPDAILREHSQLSPNDYIDAVYEEIKSTKSNILLVSHLPFVDYLVSKLVSGEEDRHLVSFVENTCVWLELKQLYSWQIVRVIQPG